MVGVSPIDGRADFSQKYVWKRRACASSVNKLLVSATASGYGTGQAFDACIRPAQGGDEMTEAGASS
jgi:hypothetical protein